MSEAKGSRRQRNAPTISDVARGPRCSPMTVSRVVNGESNVRAETASASRRRSRHSTIRRAARRARWPAARKSASACCTRNPSFNYLSQLLVGSLDQASRLNVQLIVEKCDDEAEEESAVAT